MSYKYQKYSNDKDQNGPKFSNSMITNKIKSYFAINIINFNRRKQVLNAQKQTENSFNIGYFFNSKIVKNNIDKQLFSIFNKYIRNKIKPFKSRSYLNTKSGIIHISINNYINNDYILNTHYNFNQLFYKNEVFGSKKSYDNSIFKSKKKSNGNSLDKTKFKLNNNTSHNSFLDCTLSSMKKKCKKEFVFKKNNSKILKKKHIIL